MSHAIQISVTSSEYGNIPLIPTPVPNEPHAIALEASPHFGYIRWVISDHKKFRLWEATYDIKRPVRLRIKTNTKYLGLFFILKSDVKYHVKGLDPIMLLEHQYDMFFVPNLYMECHLDPQTYIACGLNFNPSFFKAWQHLFNPLKNLLHSVEAKAPSRMQNVPMGIMPKISASLFNILHCNYSGQIRKNYLDIKITELTFQVLQSISSLRSDFKINQSDLTRMQEVRTYLLNNLSNPGTTRQLAHQFGLNDFKLKKDFKQAFGTSIYAFIIEERMQQALIRIIETDLPIAEIAHLSGYSNVSTFSTAFKTKFGYPPSTLRKGS